jgi:voltage-gated potassium channel
LLFERRHIVRLPLVFVGVIGLGVGGYMAIEGWSFFDALYMTVITVATVGYREVHPLSTAGLAFTMVFIFIGTAAFMFIFFGVGEYVIAGQIEGAFGRRRMKKQIDRLTGHYIICGYGLVGQEVARELARDAVPFVVIDVSPEAVKKCETAGYPRIEGDASSDDVLREAGIERAAGVVVATNSDVDNVYMTLSARSVNQDVLIVARANAPQSEPKLVRAGATHVTSPNSIGGRRMAGLLLKPAVVEFLDVVRYSDEFALSLDEVTVKENSVFAGVPLGEARGKAKFGGNILAVKKRDGKSIPNYAPDTLIENGDKLITIGTNEELAEFKRRC